MPAHIRFEKLTRSRQQISMVFKIDDLRFETAYWYSDIDLYRLEERFGSAFMNKLYFHIMAFEINKFVSLKPETIDLGDYAHFYTKTFETLWRKILHHVWAQWRYEHNLPFYRGPKFTNKFAKTSVSAIENTIGDTEVLSFCGGGKDSLVAMKLLERAEIPFASFAYSHSIYGPAKPQHQLIEALLQHGKPVKLHQQWVYDSFSDAPVLQLYPGYQVKSITAAETPSSIFAVLPVVLEHGYRYIALGHERSANVGNLIWEKTGEDVNHQWGKSYEAELLINRYVQDELIRNFSYFSILQPVYDVLIFNLLRQDINAVSDTHSCNIRKPWCGKCPKCAYVLLNYLAYLPQETVNTIFKENLFDIFDIEENQRWFYQMLGLAEHTPFECIGQIDEARLAFELCNRKGLDGKAMKLYRQHFPQLDIEPILEKYLSVDSQQSGIPGKFFDKIIPQMESAAIDAQR